jgi:hypothetical protein
VRKKTAKSVPVPLLSGDGVKAMLRGFVGGATLSYFSFNLLQVVLICMEDQDPGPPIKRVVRDAGTCRNFVRIIADLTPVIAAMQSVRTSHSGNFGNSAKRRPGFLFSYIRTTRGLANVM